MSENELTYESIAAHISEGFCPVCSARLLGEISLRSFMPPKANGGLCPNGCGDWVVTPTGAIRDQKIGADEWFGTFWERAK